ncbi:polymorphic toxin-type HINT domain-containing protein [Streptomyces sp. NPDC049555]|uniref:polymorphic toxin-type HINT domain-containing protein n=1 Tax=Streptomyces sp. NPDC049555 TaxID=3154930 RepID=UPI00342053A9
MLSTVLVGALLQGAGFSAAAGRAGNLPGAPDPGDPVVGHAVASKPRKVDTAPRTPQVRPNATWPQSGSLIGEPANVSGADGPAAGRSLTGNAWPVSLFVDQPSKTRSVAPVAGAGADIRILDRKASERAGVNGLVFSVTPAAEKNNLTAPAPENLGLKVNYSTFSQLYGGGYASRLHLVELPACALTTPEKAACKQAKPVAATNDTEKQTLTATKLGWKAGVAKVLAAAPDASGEKGDYKATSLSPSSTWKTDLNTGAFSWSYPMSVPEVPGGLKPNVSIGYSSSSIDGRTGNTNNQASWVGDGFEMWPGFIERRYKPCADDGEEHSDGNKPGDLCWAYDNATISFNGKAGELVPSGDNQWRLRNDDGTKIARLTDAARDNGDNDNEYWRVTTPNGTQYYFGYHKLNGWASGKSTTDSVWTVPVYGNNADEPCHKSAFKDSWCQQAWRWNLDYAVDRHGNAVTYYYNKENNSYGRNLEAKDNTSYVRGGYLKRIEYGLRSGDLFAKPLAMVAFTNAERCLPQDLDKVTCAEDTIDDKKQYWYDTPWDLNCKSGTECDKGRLSPSFWTRKRLTEVSTSVLKSDGTYAPVDSWKLDHRWGMADTDYQLLLSAIEHTGKSVTPAITLPKTTLAYTQRPNRLDKTGDGKAPFIKERLSTVADEHGGQTDVTYSQPVCDWGSLPTPETNTSRCFPQYIGGTSTTDPTQQWFNKYVVDSVTATDRTGGSPDQVTKYDYLDGAAWHFDDDDGLTKEKFKTWSQWRGYGHVRVQTGSQGVGGMKSQEDTYFLRGMDGDRKSASGGTKSVSVSLGAGEGDALADHESAAGFAYKKETYSGPGGKVLGKTVSRPWHHETAKKVRSWGTVTANFTGTEANRTFTSMDEGAGATWRQTATATVYDDATGRPTQVADSGDVTTSTDDRCTRTTYADNTDANILSLPSRVETVAAACDSANVDRSKAVISDVRTAYDGGAYGGVPDKGDATSVATLKKHDGTLATYLESGKTVDAYGRDLTTTDITGEVVFDAGGKLASSTKRSDGRTSTTTYTPAAGFPTKVTTTGPPAKAGDATTAQTSTTSVDPVRGQPLNVTDTNNRVTSIEYDALGRTRKVWLADRWKPRAPSYEFTYRIADGKPVAVGTRTVNNSDGQITSYTLYDGFLRPRQTQSPGPDKGRLITDTFYDDRGLAAKSFAPYYATDAPGTTLFTPDNALKVESQTWNAYDGQGRVTESKQVAGNGEAGKVLATARTLYGGDRTTVIPPVGSTATTTVVDARGQTTELQQLHERTVGAEADITRYAYAPTGKLARVTDPAGNAWTYEYDQLGRQISTTDPDKGTTTSTYDDRGQLISTTNSRKSKNTLFYAYDNLGRKTELREGSATGTKLAEWTYDTVTNGKGKPASSTRYVDGNAYTSRIDEYDTRYRAKQTSVVIPSSEGALAGTYKSRTNYTLSGSVMGMSFPQVGSRPGQGLIYDYDDILRPTAVLTDEGIKSEITSYSLTGKPLQAKLRQKDGRFTQVTNGYEWGTQRLATTRVDRENAPSADKAATYTYDETGNIRAISDAAGDGTDIQCFTYDYLRRVTDEWTQPAGACTGAPSGNLIGGPAPYWNSYTYDKTGNRLTETQHDLTGNAAKDTKRTYSYPGAGKPQPHALTAVDTAGPTGTARDSYTYDPTGNTATRTIRGDTQTMDWDAEGHLAKVTEPAGDKGTKTTSYLYDADGQRLIGRTDTETTLYLGALEITLPKGSTTPKGTYYFDLGNGIQAVQTDDGSASFVLGDHVGTGQLAIDTAAKTATHRRTTPFGAPRGQQPKNWPGTKGFVGGTNDTSTNLTHLGAREYDPSTGRFISVDPLMDLGDPQQNHGYSYANNNPVTLSDPDGLQPDECRYHGVSCYPTSNSGGWHVEADEEEIERYYPSAEDVEESENFPEPQPSPSPGPAPHPGPYGPGVGSTFLEKSFKFATGLFLPDFGEWKSCFADHEISGCAWAATDVPIGKWGKLAKPWLKGTKGEQKAAKGVEEGVEEGAADGKKVRCHSFVEGTAVETADGVGKGINALKVGDRVLATDPETGSTESRPVVAVIVTEQDKDFTDLTVRTSMGDASIIATDTHPFWSVDERRWVDAGNLSPGGKLRTDKGDTVTLSSVRHFRKGQRTYDITVDGIHAYYVLAGKTPVLVHNAGNCPIDGLPHGALGEMSTLQRLVSEGYSNIRQEVRFKTSQGDVFRADFVAQDRAGDWVAVEVKTGKGASLTDNQRRGYAELGHGGAMLNTSRLPGLKKGSIVKMRVEVDLWRCPACDP